MNGYQYRCVVSNSAGSATSDAATLTVHVHAWGEPAWSWSEDGKTATATFTCQNDESHQATETATVKSETKSEPTCTESGVTTYTAVVEFGGEAYTDTKDVADIPATGHKLTRTEAKAATCTKPGNTEYWTCGVCDKIFSDAGEHQLAPDDTVVPAIGHSWGEDGHCTVCGAIDPDFAPKIIAGTNATWQKGSGKDLSFTSNAAYGDFLKVQVDGKDVGATNYTVEEGSTVVTLKASYLETLSVGKHTLAIVSDTGVAETEFTITAAKEQKTASGNEKSLSQTGDDSMLPVAALIVLAAASTAAGTLLLKRSRL